MSRVPTTLVTLNVPTPLLTESWRLLREPGQDGFEASLLWIGELETITSAAIVRVLRPPQRALTRAEGSMCEIDISAFVPYLAALPADQYVLARLHTHPGPAYHSDTDDKNMIVGHEGAISIVVPEFANGPAELSRCATYRLERGGLWRELDPEEVHERIRIHDSYPSDA